MKFLCGWNIHNYKIQQVRVTYQFKDRASRELIEPAKKCLRCDKLLIKNPMLSSEPWIGVDKFKKSYKAIIEEDFV